MNNFSKIYAGGLHVKESKVMEFRNNEIVNNTSMSGGGIYAISLEALKIQDTLINENRASNMGGGGYFFQISNLEFLNVTG